jgi:hypothetical protein
MSFGGKRLGYSRVPHAIHKKSLWHPCGAIRTESVKTACSLKKLADYYSETSVVLLLGIAMYKIYAQRFLCDPIG